MNPAANSQNQPGTSKSFITEGKEKTDKRVCSGGRENWYNERRDIKPSDRVSEIDSVIQKISTMGVSGGNTAAAIATSLSEIKNEDRDVDTLIEQLNGIKVSGKFYQFLSSIGLNIEEGFRESNEYKKLEEEKVEIRQLERGALAKKIAMQKLYRKETNDWLK